MKTSLLIPALTTLAVAVSISASMADQPLPRATGVLKNPQNLATDHNGYVYVVDTDNTKAHGTIHKFDPAGQPLEDLFPSLPWGGPVWNCVAVGKNDDIYFAAYKYIWKATPSGTGYTLKEHIWLMQEVAVTSLAVDDSGNTYLAASVTPKPQLVKYDSDGKQTARSDIDTTVTNLAVDSSGIVYFTRSGEGKVYRAESQGSSFKFDVLLASGLQEPSGIALDKSAGLLYVADRAQGTVQMYSLDGKLIRTIVSHLPNLGRIAVDGGKVYIMDGKQVLKYDTGDLYSERYQRHIFTTHDPASLAIDRDGTCVVAQGANSHTISFYDRNGKKLSETLPFSASAVAVGGHPNSFYCATRDDGSAYGRSLLKIDGYGESAFHVTERYTGGFDAIHGLAVEPDGGAIYAGVHDPRIPTGYGIRKFGKDAHNNWLVTDITTFDKPVSGLAVDPKGNVYFCIDRSPYVWVARPQESGYNVEAFVGLDQLRRPLAIAVDYNGVIYVADSHGTISKFTPEGSPLGSVAKNLGALKTIAFDKNDNLYAVFSPHEFTSDWKVSVFLKGITNFIN